MKVVLMLAAAVLLTLFEPVPAVDIDNAFTQDGTTTYCMGVSAANGSVGTLSFESLEANNVGRCPVGLALTLVAPDFRANDPITVQWAAKMIPGLKNAIFPNAIDAATNLPGTVTISSLFACTFGTNCATNVGGTPTGADGTRTGPFSPDGTKALETNTFTLEAAGDYILVGLISLPGDSTLNLVAEEYIVFKKINVAAADLSASTSGSPIVSPDSINASAATSKNDAGSQPTEQISNADEASREAAVSDHAIKTQPTGTVASNEKAEEMDAEQRGAVEAASTSSGNGNFLKEHGMVLMAAVVGCCVVGVLVFVFVMRRRKDRRNKGNKGSLAGDMEDLGSKGDHMYVTNTTARSNNNGTDTMMDEESSVVMMPSAERGSELNSSNCSSAAHSLPKSSLDPDEFSANASYGAVGYGRKAPVDAYRGSNISSVAGQSEASMSNFGDSIVSARQKQYLQPSDWNEPVPSTNSRLKPMEQSPKEKRSFGGHSIVSRYSDDKASRVSGTSSHGSTPGLGFSMSSRPSDARFTDDYRVTKELRSTDDFRTPAFSEALGQPRLQSEASIDSYGYRTSRSSVDSYSSGMSSFSREGSRISRFSAASSLARSSDISKG